MLGPSMCALAQVSRRYIYVLTLVEKCISGTNLYKSILLFLKDIHLWAIWYGIGSGIRIGKRRWDGDKIYPITHVHFLILVSKHGISYILPLLFLSYSSFHTIRTPPKITSSVAHAQHILFLVLGFLWIEVFFIKFYFFSKLFCFP